MIMGFYPFLAYFSYKEYTLTLKEYNFLIIIIKESYMKHTYLSKPGIKEALHSHAITREEAEKLQKKVDCQVTIYKVIHK